MFDLLFKIFMGLFIGGAIGYTLTTLFSKIWELFQSIRKTHMSKFITAIYFLGAISTIGWTWHRDCSPLDVDNPHATPSVVCSSFYGAVWPVFWTFKTAIAVFDPANMPSIQFPTVTFEKTK